MIILRVEQRGGFGWGNARKIVAASWELFRKRHFPGWKVFTWQRRSTKFKKLGMVV